VEGSELDRRIAHERDPDQQSRLQRARDAAADVGADLVGSAIVVAMRL
jgi:hypothetical protein